MSWPHNGGDFPPKARGSASWLSGGLGSVRCLWLSIEKWVHWTVNMGRQTMIEQGFALQHHHPSSTWVSPYLMMRQLQVVIVILDLFEKNPNVRPPSVSSRLIIDTLGGRTLGFFFEQIEDNDYDTIANMYVLLARTNQLVQRLRQCADTNSGDAAGLRGRTYMADYSFSTNAKHSMSSSTRAHRVSSLDCLSSSSAATESLPSRPRKAR